MQRRMAWKRMWIVAVQNAPHALWQKAVMAQQIAIRVFARAAYVPLQHVTMA
jgi:hypothetical protein